MAIYKPSNFYPKLEEIDIEKEDNVFSCQINTDGEEIKAYKMNILLPSNSLIYKGFFDLGKSLHNKDFLEITLSHYQIQNYNTKFANDDQLVTDPTVRINFFSYLENNQTKEDYSKIKIQNLGFTALADNNLYYQDNNFNYYWKHKSLSNPEEIKYEVIENSSHGELITYNGQTFLRILSEATPTMTEGTDEFERTTSVESNFDNSYTQTIDRQYKEYSNTNTFELKRFTETYRLYLILTFSDYCNYCLYYIKVKELKCFAIKINGEDCNIVDVDYVKQTNGLYTVLLSISKTLNPETFNSLPKISIHLLNDFDYVWNIRLYQSYSTEKKVENNTKISTGYITGSTDNVFWYNIKTLKDSALQNLSNFNDSHYIEVIANEDNSDFCKEQLKLGQTLSGTIKQVGRENSTEISTDNLLKNSNFKDMYVSRYNPGENTLNVSRKFEKVTYFGNLKDSSGTGLKNGVSGVSLTGGSYNYNSDYLVYLPPEECDWRFTDYSLFCYHLWGALSSGVYQLVNNGKISLASRYDSSKTTTLYQNIYNIDSGTEYQFSAQFSGLGYRTKNENYTSSDNWSFKYPITIKVFEKNNLNKSITYVKEVTFLSTNKSPSYETTFLVPSDYVIPVVQIQFPISSFSYINDKGYSYLLDMENPQLIKTNLPENEQILLDNTCVNLSKYNDNLMLRVTHKSNEITDYKIKKFYEGNHSVTLQKPLTQINTTIETNISKDDQYQIFYKQREKIDMHTSDLGIDYNIGKIETEHSFPINLKDGSEIQLYKTNNKNTLKSFFVEPNNDINVDYAYVRIPSLDNVKYYDEKRIVNGVTYLSGSFLTSDYTKRYKYSSNSMIEYSSGEDINIYRYCKAEDYGSYLKFSDIESITNSMFYKVVGYDLDTGEIRVANDLPRILEETDTYEVWKKVISVDITGVYETAEATGYFERIVPVNESTDIGHINGLKCCDIPIMNNNDTQLFIQPNSNLYSDVFHNAQLLFSKNNKKVQIVYNYDDTNLIVENRDQTINKLDNSQWLVQYNNLDNIQISIKDQYSLMSNFSESFNNYFYAKGLGTISVRYCDYDDYLKKIITDETSIQSLKNIMEAAINGIGMVSVFDCVFFADCKDFNTSIKCYKYKLYDKNMNLINETEKLYDDELKFIPGGLLNNTQYLLLLEIEDQLGYQYKYEHLFMTKYEEKKYTYKNFDIGFNCNVLCNDIAIQLISYEDIAYNLRSSPSKYNIDNDIYIYKKAENDLYYQFVNKLNLTNDAKNIDNKYWYTFIDYNVSNNTTYQYYIIMQRKHTSIDICYYYLNYNISVKINSWSIIDVEQNILDETQYYALDSMWNFKYNLEDENLTTNLAISKIDTLGQFPMTFFDSKNYDSSSVTCLLGDVTNYNLLDSNNHVIKKYGYIESNNVNTLSKNINNAEKYLRWKQFISNGKLKLLKDIKGNKWIVQLIDNLNSRINSNSIEQVTTISFSWAEMKNSRNISIIKNIEEDTSDKEIINKIYDQIGSNWHFKINNDIITLTKYIGSSQTITSSIFPTSISINNKKFNVQLGKTTVYQGNIDGPFIRNNTPILISTINSNISNVKIEDNDMSYMFYNQSNLKTLFDIPEGVDLENAFVGCKSLTNINFTKSTYKNINLIFGKSPIIVMNNACRINWSGCADFEKYCDLCEALINCEKITISGPSNSNWEFKIDNWHNIENTNYIILDQYKGNNQDNIYIPSKYNKKQIYVKNTCFRT